MMQFQNTVFKGAEEAVFLFRSLFEKYGYAQFKMSKFEEYDLYVRNKDFLISDGIITFTDTNGKLMALKPDVTLSIIKNSKPERGTVSKVYYNENVYRVSPGTHSFKEIMQVGIECMGDVDGYYLYEVLMLAARSLRLLSSEAVLDISHFGMVSDLIDSMGISDSAKKRLFQAIGEKNAHEVACFCGELGVSDENAELLKLLTTTYGRPGNVLPKLREALFGKVSEDAFLFLETICKNLADAGYGDMIRIDFSVVNHTDYYNGIIFKGFLKGIPTSILSGGQYDRLMKRLGRCAGAVGFAVYLDLLDEIQGEKKEFDIDAVILYDNKTDPSLVRGAVEKLTLEGKSVMAQKKVPEKLRFRELYQINESGVSLLERLA